MFLSESAPKCLAMPSLGPLRVGCLLVLCCQATALDALRARSRLRQRQEHSLATQWASE
eukprot:CAMPEP_0171262392 /NCGR_PEP_ID=MMETSP0790-20130122/56529_1 /TAXON_ID=2925 /ORGANISM="Alexandrium catenella, Strain OF101" /LENGTH=58 /DNA_ID=CAMNT_0011730915 /DNA_START=45 /DNA_END=218 /DNA_ORIENTATION=+